LVVDSVAIASLDYALINAQQNNGNRALADRQHSPSAGPHPRAHSGVAARIAANNA
jgi:hypothetical protein